MRSRFAALQSHIWTAIVLISLLLPGRVQAKNLAVFTQMDLYANIETVGVIVNGSGLPKSAELYYRQTGSSEWRQGHPLVLIRDSRLAGSLFGLTQSTSYEIKVVDGTGSEITGATSTQPNDLLFTPSSYIYVNANAQPGGDGSSAAPFQTIQEGVNKAVPGSQVLVADGIYHESVTFPTSGTQGNWIQVKAQGGGAVLDGSTGIDPTMWTEYGGRSHVWFAKIGPSTIKYLARSGMRFYMYDDLGGLLNMSGHNRETIREGWYYDSSTGRLYVRSLADPTSHTWQMPTLVRGFYAENIDWLWIEGFEVRYYGATYGACGVCTLNSSHVVIRNNKIHNINLGIFINWTGGADRGNDTRIEYNEIYDPPVNEWPWNAVKATSMEGTALVLRGHIGAIVRENNIHNYFNGIYTGSSGALYTPEMTMDADIYNNYIHDIGDDALEPEGPSINQRFRNNKIDSVLVGISLAPITYGPVWALRSTYTNYFARSVKWDKDTNGIVFYYHNTSWSSYANRASMEFISTVHNSVMRNNIFQDNGLSIEETRNGSTNHDWNNDNFFTTKPSPKILWEGTQYSNLLEFCTKTRLECNGHDSPPGMVNPAGGDYTLLSTSPNVDRGVVIPGINDYYYGGAPDIGAFESTYGSPPPATETPPPATEPPPPVDNNTPDTTPPFVVGITRADANPTNADTLHFNVNFSENISGLDASDLQLITSGDLNGTYINEVSGSGAGYVVSVNAGVGSGSLRLDLIDNDSIIDDSSNPLGGLNAGNGNFIGEEYTVNRAAPTVISASVADPNPSSADSVRFLVSFSESVSGVDAADFGLTVSGVEGAGITGVSGMANLYFVFVDTGTGTGSIQLDVLDNDSIVNAAGIPLGGPGFGNGNFNSGEAYTIEEPVIVKKTETFTSEGAADGWILEWHEDREQGLYKNSSETTFIVGDDVRDRQYRSILQFPTQSLPDDAIVTMVVLTIRSQSIVGMNPFGTHGNIAIDIRNGSFGAPLDLLGINALQRWAFQALPSRYNVGVMANNPQADWYWSSLDASAYPLVNLDGVTQFRLRFQLDDNDDRGDDYFRFYSGDYPEVSSRPQLIVEYEVP